MTKLEFMQKIKAVEAQVEALLPDGFALVGIIRGEDSTVHGFTAVQGERKDIQNELFQSCQKSKMLRELVKEVNFDLYMESVKDEKRLYIKKS